MLEIINNLSFLKLRFCLSFNEKAYLPEYHGSMLRGFFGHSLKRMVCKVNDIECKDCFLKEDCIYPYIFETIQSNNYNIMKNANNLPHPYIFEPLEFDGKNLYFNLILIGKSINYISYIIYSFMKGYLGKKGQDFYLNKVECETKNELIEIYNNKDKILKKEFKPLSIKDLDYNLTDKIELDFLTPTRIKFNGNYSNNLDFNSFIKNLSRRLILLSYFHSDSENILNSIVKDSEKVKTLDSSLYMSHISRYSNKQNRSMDFYGFKGKVTFYGDLEKFIPLIVLGEFLHVGNCTTFGLGKYSLNFFRCSVIV